MKNAICFTAIILIGLSVISCNNKPTTDCDLPKELRQAKSDDYQKALINYLSNSSPSDYSYEFETFMGKDGKTYMITNFKKDQECFEVEVLITNWSKLAGMRKTNGKSYPKALKNLKWEIFNIGGVETVLYKDMGDIID